MRASLKKRPPLLPVAALVTAFLAVGVAAADLKPKTIAAFDRYQTAAEQSIATDLAAPDRFLRALRHPEQRSALEAQLRRGEVVVERLNVRLDGKDIDVPDGLLHHWLGAVFVPGVRVDQAVTLLQDYDKHSQYFKPNVVRSKTLEHEGDRYRLFLRFYFKKVISVTVNTESVGQYTRHGPDRVSSSIRSTRIAEVENPDTPSERELPVGHDGGFLWRLNTYWRFLERDGGTYIECESLTLTRGIPIGLGWVIGPFVTSIPRETLAMTLGATRRTLTKP
jgi:hypothetical protein